ncbi:MAG TPA: DegV family protein [Thermoanaerobacterales bacterium]|nr:DegV family protein [Thermoanaerobacterales bacterium]
MKKAIIITDTSCDLPGEIIDQYPIKVLPMPVSVKDKPEMNISGLTVKEFYDMMRNNQIMPTTSQVSVATFIKTFEECLKENYAPVVIGLSSKLTSSYQSALMAKDTLKSDDIVVLDSKCASLGQGLVVMKAAKMARDGKNPKEIVEEIVPYAEHMEHIFTVDSLDHLKRGGRISAAQAFVGSLLNIKPILHFVDGAIQPLEKVRGRKNVIKRMVEIMAQRGKNIENQIIGISHGDNEEMALELADTIKTKYGVKDIIISWIGPVIGSHAGPGTLALFFQNA